MPNILYTLTLVIKANRIFDREVMEVARLHANPDTAVLDVGANFGQMSILFSNLVGEHGKVYSFDADDFVFSILKKNIDANYLFPETCNPTRSSPVVAGV